MIDNNTRNPIQMRTRVAWSGWTETEDIQLIKNYTAKVDITTNIAAKRTECIERHIYLMRKNDSDYNRRPIPWVNRK